MVGLLAATTVSFAAAFWTTGFGAEATITGFSLVTGALATLDSCNFTITLLPTGVNSKSCDAAISTTTRVTGGAAWN